ncbi:uncharacterized protein [Littorina saxatilis]|uniref:Apple domain-containing protein n=1 Tax=Littorina saxatilis TaxID=31220 RepID=A0AAN9GH40_9CAEN
MPLVLMILVGVFASVSATTITTKSDVYINVGVDNKAFSENIIFEQPAKSRLHCAALCEQQPCCVTFTFDQEVCRGHTMFVTSDPSSTPTPGARSFAREDREWLDTTCDNNDACAEPNAVCFTGLCKCSPGYYYSQCTQTCLSSCEPSKLTEPFQEYKGSVIYPTQILNTNNVTLEQCLQGCMDNTQCMSVDYNFGDKKCYQKGVTARTAEGPDKFRTGWGDYNHYQKSCAN